MIDDEIKSHKQSGKGYILFKNNSIVDDEVIMKLYQASKAGVKVDLLTRGICRLRPHLKGLSENISVYSIVGRFLEHSRAYYFHNNGDPKLYLGSADIMQRNFDRRVEIFFPIEDPRVKEDIVEILELYLTDTVKTRVMLSNGDYVRKSSLLKEKGEPFKDINIQEHFVKKVIRKHERELKEEMRKKVLAKEATKVKSEIQHNS